MKWYKRIALVLISLQPVIFFATPGVAANDLLVSAALSLKAPFEEIGRAYEKKYPGQKVVFNFAASGILLKQIEAGAPTDVFASASPKEMDTLEAAGLIVSGTRNNFAGNSLVLISAANAPVRITSFSDLKMTDLKRIAIGNPASVPAGKYAEETLKAIGLWEPLKTKLVYAENVRQVMDYTVRNEVDAGMVFFTDAIAGGRGLKVVAEAPASSHSPVAYPIAAIRGSRNEAAAKVFIAMVMAKEGRDILLRHGFTVRT